MSFFAFLRSLRSRVHGSARKHSRSRPKHSSSRSSVAISGIERLEQRDLMAVLPAPIISNQQELTPPAPDLSSVPASSSPAVAINPVNPNKVVLAYADSDYRPVNNPQDYLTVQFSTDKGQTWQFGTIQFPQLDPTSPQNNPAVYPRVSKPTIAFDRDENFYVVYTVHDNTFNSGSIVFQAFNFSGGFPVQTVTNNYLYRWTGQDAAFNPTVAVDTSIPFFKDPVTGKVQLNPSANKAVYVVWNTVVGPIGSANTTSAVKMAVSSDRGQTFSGEVLVNDNPIYQPGNNPRFTHASAPSIAFSQGTSDGRVPGGQVTVTWFNNQNFATTGVPLDTIQVDTYNPGAVPPTSAVFNAGFTRITDATANNVPVATDIPFAVNITDPNFGTLSDLDVEINLVHANLDHISIELIAPPDPANPNIINSVFLLQNRVDAAGNTRNNTGLPGSDGLGMYYARNNGFAVGLREVGTVFDDEALRSITDTSVANPQPYVGHFRPEGAGFFGGLSQFYGLRPDLLNGTWTLRITDFRNNGNNPPPNQFLSSARLRMTSRLNNTALGTDQTVASVIPDTNNRQFPGSPLRDTGTYDYPLKSTYTNAAGIGPAPVIAVDNTLGSFSPYQGRMYLAYTGVGRVGEGSISFSALDRADNTDIFLLISDDGGQTWQPNNTSPLTGFAIPVNEDAITITPTGGFTLGDGFSEGNRAQFQPQLAVDPVTGTLAISYVDGRYDAGRARTVITLTTSIDGGSTFSKQVPVNRQKTAIDATTRQTVNLEPIPTNMAAAVGADGVGFQTGLAIYGGTIIPVWSGNNNGPYAGIQSAVANIAAGPRVINATMGPVTGSGTVNQGNLTGTYNTSTGADGRQAVDGFVLTYDRPIDPSTLNPADIRILYRSPTTPTSQPATQIPTDQVSITATDNVGANGQPIAVTPQLYLGDATLLEGNSGQRSAIFTVFLSFPLVQDLTVQYTTSSGTAIAGLDFVTTTGTLTIRAGQSSGTFSIPVIGDALQEGNETFNVTLSNPSAGSALSRAMGIGTIIDDDGAPSLSVGDLSLREGTAANSNAVFQVFLSFPSNQTVTVRYATADSTALVAQDYLGVTGTLTFLPGETIKSVTVPVVGDSLPELNEQFFLDLSSPTGAVIDRGRGKATIIDDDSASVINASVSDATVLEGNGPNGTQAVFTVFLDAPSTTPLTINYSTSDGTAISGQDYDSRSGTLTIPAGQTSRTITVNVIPNLLPQNNRVFVLDLSNPGVGLAVRRGRGFGSIIDDDGVPDITIRDVTILEGNVGTSQAGFNVLLSSPANGPVVVNYSLVNGTAAAGTDFQAIPGNPLTLTIPAGQTSATIPVNIIGNLLRQDNRQFTVVINSVTGARIARGATGTPADRATGTIVDDDSIPVVNATNVITNEFGSAVFTLYLSTTTVQTITVNYATASGRAISGVDFTQTAGTVTFLPGEISRAIFVPVQFDNFSDEGPEDFFLNLTGATNVALGQTQATATILDDGPNIYVNDAYIREGNGSSTATFTVFLDLPVQPGSSVQVAYSTQDDTARDGTDYDLVTGTLTFLPGQSSQTVAVNIRGNTIVDGDRSFKFVLSNPIGGSILRPEGIGTIVDDDGPVPSYSIGDAIAIEGNDMVFRVVLSQASPISQSIDYTTSNGTAIGNVDYDITRDTLVFAPGETTKDIRVRIRTDAVDERPETFLLQLLPSATTLPVSRGTATGTIINLRADQGIVGVSDAVVLEGSGAGTTSMVFTISSSFGAGLVSVNYTTQDGTARAGTDYQAASGTINFFGSTTLTIFVTNNNVEQANRTFTLRLSNAQGATLVQSTATGIILDNDVNINIADTTDFEGNAGSTPFNFPIILDRPVPGRVNLNLTVNTQSGTAIAGADFTAVTNGTATILAGQIAGTTTVNGIGDQTPEPNENFGVRLSAPSTGTLVKATATGLIVNDDVTVGSRIVTVGPATVAEGTANAPTQLIFPLFLMNPVGVPVTVNYTTQDGTAVDGIDYTGVPVGVTGSVVIPANQTRGQIAINVLPNASPNALPNRDMQLILLGATNASITPSPGNQATGLILDDDFIPNLTIGDVTVTETDSGFVDATFTVLLSAPNFQQDVTLRYTTADGTATAGVDYTSASGPVTIPAGQTSATITVRVQGDFNSESIENFFVNLFNVEGATVLRGQGIGEILDNDDVRVSVGDVTVVEGNVGTRTATFNLFLNRISNRPVVVSYTTGDGSATGGLDYQRLTGTVTFAPGETTKSVPVQIIGDSIREGTTVDPQEFFTLNLIQATGAGILRGAGVGTIVDDDSIPISISDVTVQEGDSGNQTVVFNVLLAAPAPSTLTVDYTTVDGTATAADNDYIPVSGTITIQAGALGATIPVQVVGDTKVEGHESFTVRLSNPSLGTILQANGTGTILNDDTIRATVSAGDTAVVEGGTAVFNVVLNYPVSQNISINYTTVDGTAVAGRDYTQTSGVVTIPAGQTSATIQVRTTGNSIADGNRIFSVQLSNPAGAVVARSTGIGTILDDDRLTLTINDVSIREGDSGLSTATFTVFLNQPSDTPVTFSWATTGGTAISATDFLPDTEVLTIPANDSSATFSVQVVGNTIPESNRTVILSLRNVTGAGVAKGQGVLTIVDDDTTPPEISVSNVVVREGTGGTTQALFTVNLSNPAPSDVTVAYTTADGTALSGSDYTATTGTLTIAAGQTSATIPVNIVGDSLIEGNESFSVTLSNSSGAAIREGTATGLLVDDEVQPFVSIGDVTVREGQLGTSQAIFTIFLSSPATSPVVISYATQNATATAGSDYTAIASGQVTIASGQTSATIAVSVLGETVQEGNEEFRVNLTSATNAVIRRSQGTGLIIDDETPLPSISIGDMIVKEGDFGQATATFTVFLSNIHNREVRVDYATADGSARAGKDYVTVTGTLVIPAGQSSATIPVQILGNQSRDGLHSFFMNLSNPIESVVARPQGTANIADDDDRDAATQFLVRFTPQSGVGTYSYSIGPSVQDLVRSGTVTGGANTLFTPTDTPKVIDPSSQGLRTSRIVVPAQPATIRVTNPSVTLYLSDEAVNAGFFPGFGAELNASYRISLQAPDGTTVRLFDRNQLSGQNVYGTIFTDSATQSITLGFAPYSGSFRPADPLNVFNGKDPAGTWTLIIENFDTETTASLDNWYLDLGIGASGQVSSLGNAMDQNANGTLGQTGLDEFAAPNPQNGIPFQLPYTANTLPLIVAGPHVVSSQVPGSPATIDNLVLNKTVDAIDVTFDRDMKVSSFTGDKILRIVGPVGALPLTQILRDADGNIVTGPDGQPVIVPSVSVAPVTTTPGTTPTIARTFRITIPKQTLSGSYVITLASTLESAAGDLLDTNLNAGLDVLRSASSSTTTPRAPVTFNSGTSVAIPAGGQVDSFIDITDPFQLLGVGLSLNITHSNVPDLVAQLIAPDGTIVKLFTRVGTGGPPPQANFADTVFSDTAATPIQNGFPPFNVGPYTPQTPFSDLNGISSLGRWTLRVVNNGNRLGTINRWSLTLQKPQAGSGLGEAVADQAQVAFRIFTQDQSNPQAHNTWTPIGPASQIDPGSGARVSSRLTGVAVDPSDPSGNTVYLGGASGGIWKTTNFLTNDPQGPVYVPLTDFGGVDTINIGGITVFPRNNDPRQSVVIVTTGEGDTGTPGVGVIRSRDGGATWELLDSARNVSATGARLPQAQRDRRFIGLTSFKVLADPTPRADGNLTLYAVFSGRPADAGIWRSDDTGDTWVRLRAGQATDMAFSLGSQGTDGQLQILYGAFRGEGAFLSSNRGGTWNLMVGGQGNQQRRDLNLTTGSGFAEVPVDAPTGTPNGAKGRIVLATPALVDGDPLLNSLHQGWVYALVATTGGGLLDGLYVSKDFGRNWTQIQLPVAISNPAFTNTPAFPSNDETRPDYDPFGNGQFAQGNYDIALTVDPLNPNVVYIGGSGAGTRAPLNDLIRVDITGINDGNSFVGYNESNPDGGVVERNTTGGIGLRLPNRAHGVNDSQLLKLGFFLDYVSFTPDNSVSYTNLIRDPNNPFLRDSTLFLSNAARFTNDGANIRSFKGFTDFLGPSVDIHRFFSYRDPLTGLSRLLVANDQGIWTAVSDADGNFVTNVGLAPLATGSRNGNLQAAQMYYGATQPSVLAAELSGALFYSGNQDTGFPKSDPLLLSNGNLNWVGPNGDGSGTATDATGSGTFYQYHWPCCGTHLDPTGFFHVKLPNGNAQDSLTDLSRTNGLLQAGDNPGNNQGQWPLLGGSNFAVNPINGNAIVMSSTQSGRLFRTIDQGNNWFVIAEPADVGGAYASAVAFGAPETQSSNNLDNFIYAGNQNGQIFVTFTGGGATPGSNQWKNISAGLAGTGPVRQIVTNPKRGSHEAYAVTAFGVFYMADSSVANPTWVDITSNLFNLTRQNPYGVPGDLVPWITELTTMQADWRFALPDDPNNPTGPTHPVLYVGGRGGVFRSRDKGISWTPFPNVTTDGAPIDGGNLPVAEITEIELAQGNINPATGRPVDDRIGPNLLVAFTYGRGAFAIRLENTATSGPAVSSAGPAAAGATQAFGGVSPGGTTSVVVTFNGPVDPSTFTIDDIRTFTGPDGLAITPISVVDITPTPAPGQTNLHNVYRVTFPALSKDGLYTMTIGPSISDYAGNLMNQDGNSINGEDPADAFVLQFLVVNNDDARFLSGVYHDLLGRGADLATFQTYLNLVDGRRFSLLSPIVSALLYDANAANGEQVRAQLVRDLYNSAKPNGSYLGLGNLLGETATAGEVNYWLQFLRSGGRPDDILFDLISSERYFVQNRVGHAIGGDFTAYVNQVFQDLFRRQPNQGETDRFVGDLKTADRQARLQLASGLISTPEYFGDVVDQAYARYLGRTTDQGGRNFWIALLQTGVTQEQFFANIIGSPEYFENHSRILGITAPGTTATFVKAVYSQLFPGETALPNEIAFWENRFAAGLTRTDMVLELFNTDRYRATQGTGLIDQVYQQILGRSALSSDLIFWNNQLRAGLRREVFMVQLASSEEYFDNKKGTATSLRDQNTNWVNAAFNLFIGRTNGATPAELAGNLTYLGQIEANARRAFVGLLVRAPEYFDGTVERAYSTYLGRSATQAEKDFWRPFLPAQGTPQAQSPIEIFYGNVFASMEYFNQQLDAGGFHSNLAWVTSIYQNLGLGTSNPAINTTVDTMVAAYRAERLQVVNEFLNGDEYLRRFIATTYQTYLGRQPTTSPIDETAAALDRFRSERITQEQFIASLIGTQAYFNRTPTILGQPVQPTSTTFIQAVYQQLFNVAPTAAEIQFWLERFNGGLTREAMANELLVTDRYRVDPTNGLVRRLYVLYLNRTPSAAELNYWRGQYQAGIRTEQLIADLLSSSNYFGLSHQFP